MAALLLRRVVQFGLGSFQSTDAHLLDLFLTSRDEAAFAEVVRRHGPMVHGVCRRVLRNDADADDAYQAVFLVLARKAAIIRPPDMLGNWLYGVAYRIACKARTLRDRRQRRETSATVFAVSTDSRDPDLSAILDRELSLLPDHYRLPVVLCDLEGKTRREAAAQLGWPEGTVAGRLARGRATLARRLIRLGVAPSIAVGTVSAGAAPLPELSVVIVAQAALGGAASPRAVELAQAIMPVVASTKWKAIGLSTGLILALTIGSVAGFRPAAADPGAGGTVISSAVPAAFQWANVTTPAAPGKKRDTSEAKPAISAADSAADKPATSTAEVATAKPADDVPDDVAEIKYHLAEPKPSALADARARYEFARQVSDDLIGKKQVEESTFGRAVTGLKRNNTANIRKNDPEIHEFSRYLLGELLYQHRDYDKAINPLRDALREYPKSAWAIQRRFILGRCYWYLAAKDSSQVRRNNLLEPFEKLPDSVTTRYRGNLEKARTEFVFVADTLLAYERAKTLEATDRAFLDQALFARAECTFFLEEYEEAIRQYEGLQKRHVGKFQELVALSQLWQCYKQFFGKTENARKVADQLADLLNKLPDSEFDASIPIRTRHFWKSWLDQVRQ